MAKKRGPKRTLTQREKDLQTAAQLDRRGYNQYAIAEALNISQQQVSFDLKAVREMYRKQTMEEMGVQIEEKRRQYRDLRIEAWEAWERSKEDARRVSEEAVVPVKMEKSRGKVKVVEGGKPRTTKVTTTTEGRLPANEYLVTILKCLEAERQLDGLDPTKKVKVEADNSFWSVLAGLNDATSMDEIEERIAQYRIESHSTPPLEVPVEVNGQSTETKPSVNGKNGHSKNGKPK